jgi:cyanate permease
MDISGKGGRGHIEESAAYGNIEAPDQPRYRWIMLALVSSLYFSFGLVSRSLAPLVTPILKDLDISNAQMGLIMGSWPLSYMAVAAMVGALIDRWGIRRSLFIGIVIIGLSATLRYFANGFMAMFLCVALFGIGGPMISVGCPATVAAWFKGKDRSTAVGVYTASSTMGRLVVLSVTNSVLMPLTAYSWRLTFVSLGTVVFVIALMWWFFAKDAVSGEQRKDLSITRVFFDLIAMRNVQLVLVIGFLSMAAGHGMSDWLPRILETGGLPPAIAGFAASIPDVVGLPFALIGPRMVPPRLRGRVVAAMAGVGALALFLVATQTGLFLLSGLILLGSINWAAMPMLMLILMDMPEIGSQNMGSAAGLYFCVSEIGGFAGPFMMGALVDLTGAFMAGVFALAFLRIAIVGMALMLRTKPH